MNNPECSFFVGATVGQFLMFRIAIGLAAFFILYKIVDKLALTPLLEFLKKKIWRKRN